MLDCAFCFLFSFFNKQHRKASAAAAVPNAGTTAYAAGKSGSHPLKGVRADAE